MEKIEMETEGLTHSSSHAAASIFGNIATMDSIPYVSEYILQMFWLTPNLSRKN
jgi:hypothetical protein